MSPPSSPVTWDQRQTHLCCWCADEVTEGKTKPRCRGRVGDTSATRERDVGRRSLTLSFSVASLCPSAAWGPRRNRRRSPPRHSVQTPLARGTARQPGTRPLRNQRVRGQKRRNADTHRHCLSLRCRLLRKRTETCPRLRQGSVTPQWLRTVSEATQACGVLTRRSRSSVLSRACDPVARPDACGSGCAPSGHRGVRGRDRRRETQTQAEARPRGLGGGCDRGAEGDRGAGPTALAGPRVLTPPPVSPEASAGLTPAATGRVSGDQGLALCCFSVFKFGFVCLFCFLQSAGERSQASVPGRDSTVGHGPVSLSLVQDATGGGRGVRAGAGLGAAAPGPPPLRG